MHFCRIRPTRGTRPACGSYRAVAGCAVLAMSAGLGLAAYPATAATAPAAAGPSWQTVTFEGVSLRVPASWPVVSLARHPRACPRLNVHAVYLGTPGPDPACRADLQGRTTAVMLQRVNAAGPDLRQATRATVVGGRSARTNADAGVTHAIIDVLPSAGVEVSLSYGAGPGLAAAIESTIKVAASRQARPMRLAAPAALTPAAAQGLVKGPGFDTCAAPSSATMRSWLASPYRSVGIYIGGVNRACAQANLTPAWIKTVQAQGWHYFPLYVGLQASCVAASGDATINAASAAAQGKAAADDAVTQAGDLGIPAGTPIIFDMEAYRGGCGAEVTTFLSAWDSELHARGQVAGIYESFSNIGDLVGAAGRMTEPDVIHYADWDGRATTRSPYMPSNLWTSHQRIHQYAGGHSETYQGVTINIDDDQLDVSLNGAPAGGQRRPAFRIATAMNANGSAEWFARAANDTLRHNYQHPIGSASWSATRTVGHSPADIVSNPAVAANADGSLTLFARTTGGQIAHAWQQAGAPNDWNWGSPPGGGPPPGTAVADPAAIRAPGGDVVVLTTTATGAVDATSQESPSNNTGWTAWTAIGGACASSPVPFVDSRKTLEVFCRTSGGALAVDTAGPGGWGSWRTVPGGPSGLTGTPAAVTGGGGQAEVFARASAGTLAYAWQAPGGSWSWGSSPAGSRATKNSPAVVAWPGHGVGVLAQQSDGQLGYAVQQGGGSAAWGSWTLLGSGLLGSPAAWANAGGAPEVAILTKRLQIAVSTYSAGGWSPWTPLGGGY